MQKINFIFFGRLELEKGFDLIIDLIKSFSNRDNVFFNIFGKGSLEKELLKLDLQNFKYHGWQNKEFIKNFLINSQYSLMPSRFLETFGLSALESLKEGIPVVGFKKGGLNNFVLDELNINNHNGKTESEKLINLIDNLVLNFDFDKWTQLSISVKKMSTNYSFEKWNSSFESIVF